MSDEPTPTPTPTPEPPAPKESAQEQTFTQADVNAEVDKIAARIRAEERRKVSEQYADYSELKEKAGTAATLEERVASIEQQAKDSDARAMRAEVAVVKGLTESQAKRLIGGAREEMLADADDLLADIGTQKQHGNHVPREGTNPKAPEDDMRAFARQVFGKA